MARADQQFEAGSRDAVVFAGGLQSGRRQFAIDHRAFEPEPPQLLAHVLSVPMAFNGETFVRCRCGLVFGNRHGAIPESCPVEEIDAIYEAGIARLEVERLAGLARKRAAFRADAERFALARAAEIRG